MECNKEEAIRAKDIAEGLMQNRNFTAGRKLVLKAQKLYNDLENISQMLMVCDVHCAAEARLFGNEMDWYGILQIEQSADEATIKKQYRKFALQLHPDKNKFPGAEAAFKLIGEAQRVLLDRSKRSMHDLKRKASVSNPAASYKVPQRASSYPHHAVQNDVRSNSTGIKLEHQQPRQQAPSVVFNGRPAFWTMCPFCSVRYQYYRELINKCIRCQACNKPFTAYEMSAQGAAPATNASQPVFPQQKDVPNPGGRKVGERCQRTSRADNSKADNSKEECFPKTGCTSEVCTEKVNGKRKKKQLAESSESCETENSTSSEEDMIVDDNGGLGMGQEFGSHGEHHPRRSGRHKQQVSYQENISDDDDFVSHPKRAKGSGASCANEEESEGSLKKEAPKIDEQADLKEDKKVGKQRENACFQETVTKKVNKKEKAGADDSNRSSDAHANDCKKNSEAYTDAYKESSEVHHSTSDSNSKGREEPVLFSYPDPDFYDFDNDRKKECFAVGQIWAIYDTLDAMPRFYAHIKRVYSSGFKLQITWLEPDPDDENEIQWVNEDLPVSCGKFRRGNSESTEDLLMFSHLIEWGKGSRRDTYKIFPRKGETWALFKNWDIKWSLDPDSHQKYEYEFVEILSEFFEDVGISVAYLSKVKGFSSVFCCIVGEGTGTIQIPPAELFRFSHRVPSFKLTGDEREGVPKGSFELDPASLPVNMEEISIPVNFKVDVGNADPSNSRSRSSDELKPVMVPKEAASVHHRDVETHLNPGDDSSWNNNEDPNAPLTSTPRAVAFPEPQFYDFDAKKSQEKFQIGQIWSLYSDEDGLPKYYGQIEKIESEPEFKLHVRWLVTCSLPDGVIQWHDEEILICCGRFKAKKGRPQAFSLTTSFSHQLQADPAGRKNEYTIFPKKGDIWALYQNWSAGIKNSELKNCDYDIVEVMGENDLHIEVLVLERVDGFNSVFKASLKDRSPITMVIPREELLRFSHQIPAFLLTEERGGSLRGFWELDPAALPLHYFPH